MINPETRYILTVTDHNGVHVTRSAPITFEDRAATFKELIAKYPIQTHYIFFEKVGAKANA